MSDAARVTIRELAAALNRKPEQVEAEAAALGMFVGPDWSGQPSPPVADAKGLASGEARRNLKHDRAWEQHQRRLVKDMRPLAPAGRHGR